MSHVTIRQNQIMRKHGTASAHYGSGLCYKPNAIKRAVREEMKERLRSDIALCDRMIQRQTRKQKPNMKLFNTWIAKRQDKMIQLRRLERAG